MVEIFLGQKYVYLQYYQKRSCAKLPVCEFLQFISESIPQLGVFFIYWFIQKINELPIVVPIV